MFKFSQRGDYIKPNAKPWQEIKPKSYETQVVDFASALEWLKEWWRVEDCDNGGEFVYIVGLTDGREKRYYKVDHDFTPHWGDDFYVDNWYNVKQIERQEANIPDDRDWLNISEYNYKLRKWPPND